MTDQLERRATRVGDPRHPLWAFLRRCRTWVDGYPSLRWVYRLAVALLGTVIIIVGVILIPLPGPGWLIVFLGVACLGTEFPAAHRVAAFMKRVLMRAMAWWRSRRAANTARATAAE
ncbi:hypothetical protein JF66_08695 [Cryobacterium sp. MLB-32]|uniref:TIGR02611 family protein n=1 Tax=Cryobacterium sp. MLB-32 TaxID=1529318 RepID=UPI0004E7BFEE|nr:TIGR02611 family protein [Cryobacterium sp. MLB-32]KFF59802.1 hypothetical protein JF66_08695 [Cryobacterium sp. MLB-32]